MLNLLPEDQPTFLEGIQLTSMMSEGPGSAGRIEVTDAPDSMATAWLGNEPVGFGQMFLDGS